MAKWVCNLTWQDAPHLSEKAKEELLQSYSPHERDARSKGIPQLGAGAIYPVVESDVIVEPFRIPEHWPRAYALDVGWNKTAAVWGTYDQKSDVWYLYSEHYRGQAEPSIHADAIKARGSWMAGVVDCHSKARGNAYGEQLSVLYANLGLHLDNAENGPGTLEPGILDVYQRLSSGRLKVFSHLLNWRAEFRIYRRDKNGRIVDKNDHLMDCTRFLVTSGHKIMDTPPPEFAEDGIQYRPSSKQGRSDICGY